MKTMKHIMLVEDEVELAQLVRDYLEAAGFEVSMFHDGQDAYTQFQQRKPSLMILDLMVPRMDGLTICRKVREQSDLPIIMVTARTEEIDRVLGLNMGADDYITKPFNTREVVARVKAVLRRSGQQKAAPKGQEIIEYPNLTINLSEYRVIAFGKQVVFTAKEMELLWHLASNPGIVFSRNQLLETIWGYTYYGDTRTVDTHIKRVRHKLDIPKDSQWDIQTVWGVGYKFEVKK